MDKITLLILAICLSLPTVSCGDHDNLLANSGSPLIHNSFYIKQGEEKQFPDPNITYNNAHRGMLPYRALSLKNSFKLALTYDDGPHPTRTPRLLDILKKYRVKATFFALGSLIKTYPKIAQRIVDEGHILASHDWRHDNSNGESRSNFKSGLKQSLLQVKNHYQEKESYYRFPYGAYGKSNGYHHFNVIKELSQEMFSENCINFAFWDIDTSDWVSNMTAQNISQTLFANLDGGKAYRFKTLQGGGRTTYVKEPYTIRNPVKGGVVLMHDIHERTVQATEVFLNKAMNRNIEFILLNEVNEFSYNGTQCNLNI
ncbi:MAG: polysaccharide deacetylase family protein [Halobacteriovoraceae bacterium]|nr:polysaccharide deacetylase family protein [Halobacteriovoraceae bacterium]